MKPYLSRSEAGVKLGHFLVEQGVTADIVLGLPRGGVVVAAEVAKLLELPLDVLIVRKIGHPQHREFAVGALAENGTVWLDEAVLKSLGLSREALEPVIAEEQTRLLEYRNKFHREQPPDLRDQRVLIVDDGLATGASAEAAARSAREQGAHRVVLACPVASESGLQRLERVCDRVLSPWIDPAFEAVGRNYRNFAQTTDEEVLQILRNRE